MEVIAGGRIRMKKIGSIKLILFFTALTLVLTWLVIFGYESYMRAPFYSWVEARYPGDKQFQDQIQQRIEHFWISTTVDVIVVTLLLGLVNRQQRKLRASEERYRALFEQIEFYDNGPGVPRENIDKIVDPFFTTRRDSGGTGLGLSLSFGIIRDYGGRIWVESEPGSYTRFVVELPADFSWEAEYAESPGGGRRTEHSLDNGRVA